MKTIKVQFDLPGQECAFNLAVQTAEDGERVRREQEQRAEASRQALEWEREQQRQLFQE